MKKFFIFSVLCLFAAFGFVPAARAQSNCVITSLPYTEDFESGTLNSCYSINPLANTAGYIYPNVVAGSMWSPVHSGNYCLRSYNFEYGETSPNVPVLVFPVLDNNIDLNSLVLSFWGHINNLGNGYFVVGVMESDTAFSTFTPVQTIIPAEGNVFVEYNTYFNTYTGTGRYIAIKFPVSLGCMMRVDDIVLDQAAVCSPVQNLDVQNISGQEVTINWEPNAIGGANVYTVTLDNLTTGQEDLYTTTADTFYTFTGLDYSTDYRAFVTVVCLDNQESAPDSVDFSTLQQAIDLPYFEDFEGDATTALGPYTFSGTGVNQWVYGSAVGKPDPDALPGDPVHSIYISPDSGATNIYANSISDAYVSFNVTFPNDVMEYHLSFDYRVVGEASDYSEFDYLKVYMLNSDATIPATGAPSGVALLHNLGDVANVSDWTHFDVILNNVSGTSKQIVFYWYNNGWNLYGDNHFAAAIDNISVNGTDCGQPNNLAAVDITSDGATLTWNEVGTATSWTLYYRAEADTGAFNEVQVSNFPTYDLSGLTSNTQYLFYVVADCGSSLSNPSVTGTFRTDCGTISQLPYTENFEGGLYSTSQDAYIACWDRLTSDSSHYAYIGTSSYYAHGGEHYLDFHYTPNCHVIAILPELDASINANDLMLTFQACHTNYGFYTLGTLEVGVMTDKTNDSTFVVVDTIDISSLDAIMYAEQIVSLINYAGTGKFIAFRVSNCNGCGFYIDDLVLEQRPDCMDPVNFSVVTVGNESVTLTWNELGSATSWNIEYGAEGFTPGQGTAVVADATTFTVTGLASMTNYEFYVQADCGGTQSDWIGPVSVITGVLNMGVTGSDTLTTCNSIICDNGGNNGDYGSYCDYTVVVYPATVGSGLEITGTADLHPGAYTFGESHLYFYEGVGTNGTLMADYSGMGLNVSVASSGPITVHFTSSYYTAAGFVLNVACASCAPPAGVMVSDLTNDAATISWNGTGDQYVVYVTGDTVAEFIATGNTFMLSGLNANSNYNIQLRSLCGADSSLLSPMFSFTTPCDAITITAANPWTEDFESYTGSGNQPFQCWARPAVDATYDAPFVYCGYAPSCHSGTNSAELKGSSEMLVLPLFSNDVHDLRLSFWATSTAPLSGTLEIGVLTNVVDPSSFELVDVCGTPGPRGSDSTANGNFMGPFDFSNVTATNGRIALRYSNLSGFESWNLDDFVVELAPGCTAPADVTVSAITTTTATVTWTINGNGWKLQCKPASASDWGTEYTVTVPTYDLVNLVPNTAYQVRVKTVCDSAEESAWSAAVNFTTESAVVIIEPTVQTNAATAVMSTSATLNGEVADPGNQGILTHGFEWKLSTAATYTPLAAVASGSTFSAELSGLTPNTEYTFRAFVTTINTTTYGEPMTFTTLQQGTEPCDVPTGLHTTDIQNESISVAWDANPNVNSWNVRYRQQNGEWTSATASTNSYTITGLMGNKDYEIQVQAVCANGTSDWSASVTAHTTNVGIESWLENNVTLFPNPAKEVVNVQCTMNNAQLGGELYLFDVYGKLLQIVPIASEITQIDVSGLADGMYFVRVSTEAGVVTKTFVKK